MTKHELIEEIRSFIEKELETMKREGSSTRSKEERIGIMNAYMSINGILIKHLTS